MMRMPTTTVLCLLAGTAITPTLLAEVVPGGWVDSRIVGSELELRDANTNQVLLARHGLSMLGSFPAGVTTQMALTPKADGADVTFTVENVAGAPRKLGRFRLGMLNLGRDIEYFDFRHTGTPVAARSTTFISKAAMYPEDLYSPVAVLRNGDLAVGLSIQYPVLDYKHDVRVQIASPGGMWAEGEAGRGWLVDFGLVNLGEENSFTHMDHEATLQPGETRTYTISVRLSRDPANWVSTLVPYRDYFREHYGAVRYQRDSSPVMMYAVSDPGHLTSSNRMGFRPEHRPDVNGFGRVTSQIREYAGWDNIMLWAPSGLYYNHRDLNWPYQCLSHLDSTPQLSTFFNQQAGVPGLVAEGKHVGVWWGRAAEVALDWDAATSVDFDPHNQQHRSAAFAELDAAVRAGVTTMGLDTFTHEHTPLWDAYPWLQEVEQRYPSLHFVIEPSTCDIMHTIAPTFVSGWNAVTSRPASRNDLFNITGPNYLADFLLPGHEMWGAMRYSEHLRYFGAPSALQIHDDMQRFADFGYRPCFAVSTVTPGTITVAPTWETTLPVAIRESDPWIADIRAGRAPGTSGGGTPSQGSGTSAGSESGSGSGTDAGSGAGSGSTTQSGGNTGTQTSSGSGSSSGSTSGSSSGSSSGSGAGSGGSSGSGTTTAGNSGSNSGSNNSARSRRGSVLRSSQGSSSAGQGTRSNVQFVVVPQSSPQGSPGTTLRSRLTAEQQALLVTRGRTRVQRSRENTPGTSGDSSGSGPSQANAGGN